MKRLVILLGVAGVSLSAVFTRWSTAPALVLALYRMALSAALMAAAALVRLRRVETTCEMSEKQMTL